MYDDLKIITIKRPREQNILHVYAMGDVHVGSEQFNENAVKKKIEIIKNDPLGLVCLCGDLGDYGLKNSKTNVYKATMQPDAQQSYIYELFYPIKDKIAAAVPGNHEERITKETGLCPLYDLCVLWGIPEVYRENLAITKYMFGSVRNSKQQNIFYGLTTHGSTRTKHKKFISYFDGLDFAISGHTHTPEYSPHGKIRIDRQHVIARLVPYKEIIVDANLQPGGYGFKKEFEVPPPSELPYLELKTVSDTKSNSRVVHRIMNYHTIDIG